jgi:hypothetical protein
VSLRHPAALGKMLLRLYVHPECETVSCGKVVVVDVVHRAARLPSPALLQMGRMWMCHAQAPNTFSQTNELGNMDQSRGKKHCVREQQ